MKLNQLMFPLIRTGIKPDIEINSIQFQSSLIQRGDIYIVIRGFTNDGHKYIGEAISKGASAIVGEKTFSLCLYLIFASLIPGQH